MSGMTKLGPIMYLIVIMALVIAGGFTLIKNPYKSKFQKYEAISYQEAVDSYENMAGYPAGDDIPVAKSIEDIRNNEYCTLEVSEENVESTRTFLIKDKSESGNKSSKVGRRYTFSNVSESYTIKFNTWGNFQYWIRQIVWNIKNTSYGEWCAVTLDSGECIFVLVDLKLLDLNGDSTIKLPIGVVQDNYNLGRPTKEYESYGVEEENATWFVDMVGDWEDREVGDINVMLRFGIVFVLLIPIILFGAYKYAEKKGY